MKRMRKMAKAIGDCSFYKRLFTQGAQGRETAVTELLIVHSYNYDILLPISVLYCIVGTRFKRNSNNPALYNSLVNKYNLVLVDSEHSWLQCVDNLFQHSYGQIATPTLADLEVRSLIQSDSDIEYLLTYQKEKYSDLFHQVQTF